MSFSSPAPPSTIKPSDRRGPVPLDSFCKGERHPPPELDWPIVFICKDRDWTPVATLPGKRRTTFRVAIPARTARHKQAAVNTRWFPGKDRVLYGFRQITGFWKCVAVSDEELRGHVSVVYISIKRRLEMWPGASAVQKATFR